MGEYVGALKDVSAIDLGAVAANGALEELLHRYRATHCFID